MSLPLLNSDRLDHGRSRNLNGSSGDDGSSNTSTFYNTSTSNGSSRNPSRQSFNLEEIRGNLSRRNTTNGLPSVMLSPIGQQRRHAADQPVIDYSFPVHRESQLIEKKQAEYEYIKRKREQFAAEMAALDREEQRLRGEIGAGQQSEPTTPPEYQNNTNSGFPTALSRPNRFSSSSVVSPPSFSGRPSRTGSQVTSASERDLAYQALTGLPAQSVSGSRRESDEEEDDRYEDEVLNFDHRKAASLNRNSMPVTRRDRTAHPNYSDSFGFVNTTAYLLGDEYKTGDEHKSPDELTSTSASLTQSQLPTYLQMHTNDDKFPILIRRDGQNNGSVELSTASDALDLALSQTPAPEQNIGGWPTFARKVGSFSSVQSPTESPGHSLPPPSSGNGTPLKTPTVNRHSMGARIGAYSSDAKRPGLFTTPPTTSAIRSGSSFSTSSVPTMNSINNTNGTPTKNAANASAEQRLHNHNISLGRIPSTALVSNRQSREIPSISADVSRVDELSNNLHSLQSILHANAAPFGLNTSSSNFSPESQTVTTPLQQTSSQQNGTPLYTQQHGSNGSYSTAQQDMSNVSGSLEKLHLSGQHQLRSQAESSLSSPVGSQLGTGMQLYPQQPYMGYNPFPNGTPIRNSDNQPRVIQQRRGQYGEDASRFANISLDEVRGEIYTLCRDQHGCRYLQKKLEERKPESVQTIFAEVNEHMVELMTDPFGNYLCQKLLEHANEDQRTVLINNAAPDLVNIALNQHGTRALQKMIEFVSTPTQIEVVIIALQHSVVQMIQDLNGNHVIQKCLNRLSSKDAQFIFDAVAANCVTVGTHRHGCCVIQRCVDHASGVQKAQLVQAITNCSMDLVQDPFGNYVLQYIFDLGEESFSQPMCEAFLGAIPRLSRQKFSSNVIEKCLRIASIETRHSMIQEIINFPDFEKLADDPFANYVVQTAWDYADTTDEAQLAEKIRPVLPRMRHKPYGRRFQSKVAERDKKMGISNSGTITPSEMPSLDASAYTSPYGRHNQGLDHGLQSMNMNGGQGMGINGGYGSAMKVAQGMNMNVGYGASFATPQYNYQPSTFGAYSTGPHRQNNPAFPQFQHGHVQQQQPQAFIPFSRQQDGNGGAYY